MKLDQVAIQGAQRAAFSLLTTPAQEMRVFNHESGQFENIISVNNYYVKPENISMPATLVQEQPYLSSQQFQFDFSISAQPAGSSSVNTNNVILGKNSIVVIWGLKFLIGEGVNPASRVYRSHGITPSDDMIYNSVVSMKFEQSTLVDKIAGQDFRDVYNSPLEFDNTSGLVLWQPLRIVTGELGVFSLFINILQNVSGITLSPNQFLSVRPLIAFGQASATI